MSEAPVFEATTAEAHPADAAGGEVDADALIVAVEGFSGPLDLLLALARKQKVDLTKVSILTLVEQYLAFLDAALARRLDLAADYLVTAAWLAYLKSRLLLPAPSEPEAEEALALAEALTQRLQRLEAIRGAVVQLQARPRLGRDRLTRGAPEGLSVTTIDGFTTTLPELLRAYGTSLARAKATTLRMARPRVVPIDVVRDDLRERLRGEAEWRLLEDALPERLRGPEIRRSALASGFAAALELVRMEEIELQQEAAFEPLYVRGR
ncbi:MAG: segregation and condensation protein A [Pseudomonadota bacterium]